jgi:hypothetical protein
VNTLVAGWFNFEQMGATAGEPRPSQVKVPTQRVGRGERLMQHVAETLMTEAVP